MSREITDEQKKVYLADPTKCPFCVSKDIYPFGCYGDCDITYACKVCGAIWREEYDTLTDITITREPESTP